MDTYIILSSEQTHKQMTKKSNQETKKPRNLLDLDRSTTHRHSTRYSLIDRHFRSHEHRNLWSRFFVSSFPSPRTHFSFLIGGRWRRKIGEISPSNFSTDDQPTLLPPPEMEKFFAKARKDRWIRISGAADFLITSRLLPM